MGGILEVICNYFIKLKQMGGLLDCCLKRNTDTGAEVVTERKDIKGLQSTTMPDQPFEWTKIIIDKYSYGTKDQIDNYETLRLKLQDIRKAGVDHEQAVWKEINEVRDRANAAHQEKNFAERDALNEKAKDLKFEVASLALVNEEKVFAVFNKYFNRFQVIDLIGLTQERAIIRTQQSLTITQEALKSG